MRIYFHHASLFVLALGVAIVGVAHGQADPDSIKRRNNCRLAAQVIETGHPAPKKTWAHQYMVFCSVSEQAPMYLSAARAARHLTDTTEVGNAILPASGFQDGDLFQEVLSIAGDRGASVTARAFAFMALAETVDPAMIAHFDGFTSGLDPNGHPRGHCGGRTFHPTTPVIGPTPLPADYRDQIRVVAKTVGRDVTEPDQVRSAARCTW